MVEYFPKIDTLFKRDKKTFNVITDQFTRPEFAEHTSWLVNEKLDGANISISASKDENGNVTVEWRGRTERAQFDKFSVAHLGKRVDDWHDRLEKILSDNDLGQIEFFGELLGPKVQKGGIYRSEPDTVFYDVRVGGRLWLPWTAVQDYAVHLDYNVPFYDYGWSIDGIVDFVQNGFDTFEDQGTGGQAEGLICKTNIPLYNNAGKRLVFKLKTIDFTHGR